MIRSGKSLNKISRNLSIGKTTIYYHMRKIRGKKYQPPELKLNNLELIGEIIGFFCGDGQYINNRERWDQRIRFHFNAKENLIIEHYRKSLNFLTGRLPTLFLSNSVRIIQIHFKEFCQFILDYTNFSDKKTKTIELRKKDLLKNRRFVIGFLRGLLDSDGYVRKGRKEIYFGSISSKLFTDFLCGLNHFHFKYKTYLQKRVGRSDFYRVRLSGSEVDRFIHLIKPIKALQK